MSVSLAIDSRPIVIVVEDDQALSSALSFSLDLEGYQVRVCETGEALLATALPEDNACLVIDERLPGVSGLNALRQLRHKGIRLPAVLITTNPSSALRATAAAAAVPIVEKPLLGDALLSYIRAALAS